MELESIHKAWRRIITFIVIVAISVTVFSACDLPAKQYPFEKASYWVCDDPEITLEYRKDDQGNWILLESICLNDEVIDVSIAMRGNIYSVFPADSDYYNDRLFSGKWKYREENLVLIVEEDFLFGGQHPEIVLVPQKQ